MAWTTLFIHPLSADDENVSRLIDRTIARMDDGGVQSVWTVSNELKKIAVLEREQAVDQIISAISGASPVVKLGCSKTLIDLNEESTAIPVLIELAEGKTDTSIRLGAVAILGSTDYLGEKLKSKVESALSGILDQESDPDILVEAAKSLYLISDHQFRNKARNALKEMIESDIRNIRINAALALAEIGDIDPARNVLQEIKDEPSCQGRMAKTILKAREWERYLLNTIKDNTMNLDKGSLGGEAVSGLDLLAEIIGIIQEYHIRGDQVNEKDGIENLLTAAAKGMLNHMDPHSTYFSQKEHERWMMDLERKYAGIGAYVNTVDGVFTIIRPIYSGPAHEIGLRSGDQIWKVDGWETFNKPSEEIIRRLKGLPDTVVKVTIYRSGWKEERDFDISRADISIPSINSEMLPEKIGYIEIVQFAAGSGVELINTLKKLESDGVGNIVLDMRNNTGGYLKEAIFVSSVFLPPEKLVVYTEGRKQKRRDYMTQNVGYQWPGPVTLLLNKRSASASEIVAGALKHYGRATIVGEKTYGKGSVQNPRILSTRMPEQYEDSNRNRLYDEGEKFEDLDNDGKHDIGPMLKITSAMYYLPSGRSIHKLRDQEGSVINEGGISPEIPVKFESVDPWKEEELADLLEKDVFKNYVDKHYEENKELFVRLAEGDNFDTSQYPEFDSFFESLNVHLGKNDIRQWIRIELRRRVPDDRTPARPFPGFGFFGDYEEDSQLQAAILEIFRERGHDVHEITAYSFFADKEFEKPRSAETKDATTAKKEGGNEKEGKEGIEQ